MRLTLLRNGKFPTICKERTLGEGHRTGERRFHTIGMQNAPEGAHERLFEKLYRESFGVVYGYVRAHMASEADTEDIVSEAFLKAARAFSTFDPKRAKFSTWVTAIARNCMISHFRKTRPTAALEDVPGEAVAVSGGQSDVDNKLLVEQLLECLKDDERELIILKYQEGLRNVDIAEALDMNTSTVSTKLANALARMRTYMEEKDPHHG